MAGGLEDALLRKFDPPWNGSNKGSVITESAEIETDQLGKDGSYPEDDTMPPEIGRFSISLGQTYYSKGTINPGIKVSHLFGATDDLMTVRFSDGTPSVSTRIDRRANKSGAVRLVGSNQYIADWFQKYFQLGDQVTAKITGPYQIEFVAPGATYERPRDPVSLADT